MNTARGHASMVAMVKRSSRDSIRDSYVLVSCVRAFCVAHGTLIFTPVCRWGLRVQLLIVPRIPVPHAAAAALRTTFDTMLRALFARCGLGRIVTHLNRRDNAREHVMHVRYCGNWDDVEMTMR